MKHSDQQSINSNDLYYYNQQEQQHLVHDQDQMIWLSKQSQIMLQEFNQLVNQTKGVISRMKRFFEKYLPNQENDFYNREVWSCLVESYQKEEHEENEMHNSNLYDKLEKGKFKSYMDYNNNLLEKPVVIYGNIYSSQNSKPIQQGTKRQSNTNEPPKPPLMPYFIFLQQNRQLIKEKHPHMSLAQIGSLAGKIWKCLSEQQRQQYKDRYQEERRIYEQKMLRYHHQIRVENARKKNKSKKQSSDEQRYYGGSYNQQE